MAQRSPYFDIVRDMTVCSQLSDAYLSDKHLDYLATVAEFFSAASPKLA